MTTVKTKGFSLIEMLVVIIIISLIAGSLVAILRAGVDSFFIGESLTSLTDKASIATARMSHELVSATSLITINNDQIVFTDLSGNTISYSLNGNALTRSQNSGTPYTLCNNIAANGLAFQYYDNNYATTSITADVRAVTVALTLTETHHGFQLINTVSLRNRA